MSVSAEPTRQGVLRSTLLTGSLTAAWMLVVYSTQVVLAAWFGAGKEMDAYLAATSLPVLFTTLIIEAINLAFVPVFIEQLAQGKTKLAWRSAGFILSAMVVLLGPISAAGFVLSPGLIRLLVPGFESGRYALTVTMSQIIFPSVFFLCIAGFLSGLHYANNRFLLPALSPLLNAFVNLALILSLAARIGIVSSAWGSLCGSVAQCVILIPILFQRDIHFDLRWQGLSLDLIARSVGWRILGEIFGKGTPIVDRWIASALTVGSISYLGYASRILMLTLSLVAQSVATVLFPFLSWRAAEMDSHALGRAVSVGMRMTAMVALPVSALLIALSEPVVRLLFERGQFDAGATHAVARVLAAYFGVWLTNSLGGTVVTTLYALKQIRMVSLVEIAGTVLYMTLALTLPWAFDYLGLALALSANYLFNTGIYSYLLFVYLKIPFDFQVAVFYLKCIPAALASGAVARLAYSGMVPLWNHFLVAGTARSVADAGAVASATLAALGVYMVILWIMKAPELAMLWKAMSRRMSISFLRG